MEKERNMATFRQVIEEVFSNQNFDLIPELFSPNLVEHQFGLSPTLAGLQKDVEFLHRAFPDYSLVIEDLVADGDKVWGRMTARGTNTGGFMGPPNGKTFTVTVFDQCRFVDGKIVEHWGSPDRFALLSQLGLLPQK